MFKRFLFSTTFERTALQDLSITALRAFFGLSMAFGHGLGKIPVGDQFVAGVGALGFPYPVVFAWSAALSEFVGGILIALGFATRGGALVITATMTVAAFLRHASDPFRAKELALLYLFIALVFLVRGAGRYSVDRFVKA